VDKWAIGLRQCARSTTGASRSSRTTWHRHARQFKHSNLTASRLRCWSASANKGFRSSKTGHLHNSRKTEVCGSGTSIRDPACLDLLACITPLSERKKRLIPPCIGAGATKDAVNTRRHDRVCGDSPHAAGCRQQYLRPHTRPLHSRAAHQARQLTQSRPQRHDIRGMLFLLLGPDRPRELRVPDEWLLPGSMRERYTSRAGPECWE